MTLAGHSKSILPSFDHQPLGRVVFGPGSLLQLGDLARGLGGTRVLLVTDPGLEEAGHPQRAAAILRDAKLSVATFDAVEQNPTTRHVAEAVAVAKNHSTDLIVAVGGGSSMDCAKGVNFLLTNGGRMADYQGFGKASMPMLPSIAVPTTSGTGSESQSYALIADEKTHLKMACGDPKAAFKVSVLDPELTITQPASVTATTGIDAMAHAIESYVCTKRNPLSCMFARSAWQMLQASLARVLQAPADLDARGAMQLGAHFAGAAIENSMLGVCHACANPLTAHYGITHGIAIGIMLPHVIRYNSKVAGHWYGELTGPHHTLDGLISQFLEGARMPSCLSACGVEKGILPVLAAEAIEQWTARFNPRPVSEADTLMLYEEAF